MAIGMLPLALADLAPRLPRGDQGRGKYAPTTTKVLDRAYEAHGTELTSKEIWTFVKANGIPLQPRTRTPLERVRERMEAGSCRPWPGRTGWTATA